MVDGPRLGILGGTFNPIHLGHLIAAEEARVAMGLDEVVFIPAGEPYLRRDKDLAPKEDRWAMVRAAVATNRSFVASRLELDRPGPTYSVDTLETLHGQRSGAYWFILGADTLGQVAQWKEPKRIVRLCRLAAVSRPGLDVAGAVAELVRAVPAAAGRVDMVAGVHIGISATEVRRRVREGLSITYRVPDVVERIIKERGLYK